MIKNFLISKLLVLLLFCTSFPQVNDNQSAKIAIINECSFDDAKTGIKKLYDAYQQMESTDCFPAPCSEEQCKKVGSVILQPVLKEISDSLKQIEIRNNIIILRGCRLEMNNQLLALDNKLNISEQFITFFTKNARKFDETPVLNIPESKLGVINTEEFFDKEKGIKKLIISDDTDTKKKKCTETNACIEIVNSIQSYAANKGFGLIFDSGKNLPEEVRKLKTQDVTQDFISEYNRLNP